MSRSKKRVVPQVQIDLKDLKLQPFSWSLVFNRFDCGRIPLNRFVKNKNKAKKEEQRFRQRVVVSTPEASNECVGYYALRLGSDNALKPSAERGFQSVHLTNLAVDYRYQGQGIGRFLLMDAMDRVVRISDFAGFDALTLQSLDDDATAFYESIGFKIYEEGRQPKMLYLLTDLLKLVRHGGIPSYVPES